MLHVSVFTPIPPKNVRRFCNRIYAETPHVVQSFYQIFAENSNVF